MRMTPCQPASKAKAMSETLTNCGHDNQRLNQKAELQIEEGHRCGCYSTPNHLLSCLPTKNPSLIAKETMHSV